MVLLNDRAVPRAGAPLLTRMLAQVKAGRTVAVLQADVVSEDGKTLYARGVHTKFLPIKKADRLASAGRTQTPAASKL